MRTAQGQASQDPNQALGAGPRNKNVQRLFVDIIADAAGPYSSGIASVWLVVQRTGGEPIRPDQFLVDPSSMMPRLMLLGMEQRVTEMLLAWNTGRACVTG